ncbi:hypothetical protein Ahia01_000711000 [Argonauta hians]
MFDITITGKLALFVALPTTFVLLYLLLRHTHVGRHFLRRWKKSARFLCHRLNIGQKFIADGQEEDSKSTKCKSSMKIREIRIPSSATSAVIGTNRTTLEQIQRNYNVEIEILQDGDGACVSSSSRTQEMTVCVRGSSQATQQAELRILQIVEDVSTVSTEDMYIPASATIALIGKNSQSLRYINRVSGATVVVATTTSSSSMQLVSIEGSTEQRELAKKLINDTVDKNVTFHEDLTHTVAHSEGAAQTEVPPVPQGHLTKDAPTDLLEVMVVSVASPGHFWVHIRNENLPKLVTLQNDIEKYYSKPTHFKATQCSEVGVDDVVAVCLSKRCQWYRARITAVLHNTYRVFCLDYGYNEEVQKTDVCRLREEFLSLPFQAVECYLANVKPKDEGDWSESAYNSFENMVCINQSKILAGEIVRYQPTSHGLVPCLQLVDYDGPQVIWCNLWLRAFTKQAAAKSTNINEELVKTGHAEWSESPSDTVTVGKHKHSTLSQQVLQSEGFGSTESLTDPFLKSPPPEETPVSLPPANTGWADDFPWAWAYNEEESALGKNVCEMQTRLSNTASPTEEIRQPGAGDIKSLQETDALTKKTSETSALADHGEDSCNTASKAEEVRSHDMKSFSHW